MVVCLEEEKAKRIALMCLLELTIAVYLTLVFPHIMSYPLIWIHPKYG